LNFKFNLIKLFHADEREMKDTAHGTSGKSFLGRSIISYAFGFILLSSVIPLTVILSELNSKPVTIWWLMKTPHIKRFPVKKISDQREIQALNKTFLSRWGSNQETNRNVSLIGYDWRESLLWSSSDSWYSQSAFCSQDRSSTATLFPLTNKVPFYNDASVPWIWDAVVTNGGKLVSLILLEQYSCNFDTSLWYYHSGLSTSLDCKYCNTSQPNSLYIPSNPQSSPFTQSETATATDLPSRMASKHRLRNQNQDLDNTRYLCKYYDHHLQLVTSTISLRLSGGLLVRCPVPRAVMDLTLSPSRRVTMNLCW
jgi:hypothetical protein